MSCTSDNECPGTKVCYQNVSWSSNPSFCDCSVLYGWAGENCDEYGPEAQKTIVFSVFTIIILSLFMFVACQDVTIFLQINNQERLYSIRQTLLVWLFSVIGLFYIIIYAIISLAIIANPEDIEFGVYVPDYPAENYPRLAPGLFLMFILCVCCIVVAGFTSSLSWLEVYLLASSQGYSATTLLVYDRIFNVLRLFEICFVLISIILLGVDEINGLVVFCIASLMLLSVLMFLGKYFFSRLSKERSKNNELGLRNKQTTHEYLNMAEIIERQIVTDTRFESAVITINRTSRVVIFSLVLTVISFGIFSWELRDWRTNTEKGGLSTPFIWRELSMFGILLFLTSTYWYAHFMIQVPALGPLFGPDLDLNFSNFVARVGDKAIDKMDKQIQSTRLHTSRKKRKERIVSDEEQGDSVEKTNTKKNIFPNLFAQKDNNERIDSWAQTEADDNDDNEFDSDQV